MSLIVGLPGRQPRPFTPPASGVPLAGHWANGGYWDARTSAVADGAEVTTLAASEGDHSLVIRPTYAGPLMDVDGIDSGRALSFDGTTVRGLRCDDIVGILTHAGDWSVAVRLMNTTTDAQNAAWSAGGASYYSTNYQNGTNHFFGCEDSAGDQNVPLAEAGNNTTDSVVFAYNGANHYLYVYINGVAAAGNPYDFHHVPDATLFTVGFLETAALNGFFPYAGRIRVIAVCDSLLSSTDASDLHTAWTA